MLVGAGRKFGIIFTVATGTVLETPIRMLRTSSQMPGDTHTHAFLYTGGSMADLGLLVKPSVDIEKPEGIPNPEAISLESGESTARSVRGGVRALRVQAGEVELTLDYGRGCASDLAERAFQTLRGLLPDTDIYVLPAS